MSDDAERLAQAWIRPEIQALSAYHVPDAAGLIKLDAMENPYPWPAELVEAWLGELAHVPLNRYPDPSAARLQERLRDAMQIPPAMGLLLGNGSDELIQMMIMALAAPGRVVLAPEPTFVMYRMIAQIAGLRFVGVPLTSEFELDRPAMLEALEREQPAVVFLAYPNNPTGNLFDAADVATIVEMAPGLVVVDEAYHAFAQSSFVPELGRYSNLVVMRTLSKLGLAGLRLGLLAGPQPWLGQFDKVRLPYNITMRHHDVLDRQTAAIRRDRDALSAALRELPSLRVYPSAANFILFRCGAGQAGRIHAELKQRGVLIKNLHGSAPALADCLRVTVGTAQENSAFIAALRVCL
ncbi:MAG: histidinol-phosphate aminotransferase [Thiotrichales bacterium SG8_50]|nr:MAG: histidinol-phosphate aminotransferase [Thiotrichales bacterium SG8_50]